MYTKLPERCHTQSRPIIFLWFSMVEYRPFKLCFEVELSIVCSLLPLSLFFSHRLITRFLATDNWKPRGQSCPWSSASSLISSDASSLPAILFFFLAVPSHLHLYILLRRPLLCCLLCPILVLLLVLPRLRSWWVSFSTFLPFFCFTTPPLA